MIIPMVDKLPTTCKECFFLLVSDGWGYEFCVFQYLSDDDEEISLVYYDELDKKDKRPKWCPLVPFSELSTVVSLIEKGDQKDEIHP